MGGGPSPPWNLFLIHSVGIKGYLDCKPYFREDLRLVPKLSMTYSRFTLKSKFRFGND